MNSIQSLREQAIQQYEAFEIETRAKQREQIVATTEQLLIQLTGTDPQAIDYYVWGLLYYFSDYPIQKALEKWDIALQVDPQYNMARLYLGQGYFDLKEWSFALQAFQQVDQKRLAVEFPLWRSIKLEELMGVCHYRLGDQVTSIFFQYCERPVCTLLAKKQCQRKNNAFLNQNLRIAFETVSITGSCT